jgi:hypothetical protein
MDLDDATEVSRFDEGAWSVRVHVVQARLDSPAAGHADVYRDGVRKCRLTLVGHRHDPAAAAAALEVRARDFIREWSTRDHTGDTGLAEL